MNGQLHCGKTSYCFNCFKGEKQSLSVVNILAELALNCVKLCKISSFYIHIRL